MTQVAVVGAGITGLTTAYYLARAGCQVTVYEQERYPAQRTSYANGGQISVSNSETWTTWGNVVKGVKWLLKKDAPLLIRPSMDTDQLRWLFKFLYHTANNDHARNTGETIRMGLAARDLYEEIIQDEGIEFDRMRSGILHIYRDPEYMQAATVVQEMYRANGCEWEILDQRAVCEIEPTLYNCQSILGGAYTESDWTGDIHKFCTKLATILETKYHATFRYSYTADIKDLSLYHDCIVISAGVGSEPLARSIGDRLDIYPVKGYSVTINIKDAASHAAMPRTSLLDDQAKIVSANFGGRFRVAGTAELAGENYDIRRDRIEPLLRWVHQNFPKIDASDYSSWACLRPMTPNMMPRVGRSQRNHRVYYNTGHGHLGWTLAPFTAKQITQEITNGSSN
jgi:D-amino-acid dehydrogenase